MKLIELHYRGRPYSINPMYLVTVNPLIKGGCEVVTVGGSWLTDESYEAVMFMIKAVSNG